ncbi:MAG: cryptochrome/photolyase family protein [Cryomorphaceae bacterium]|nr:cryptochrome/photolyase family protein [Cryomorphaceae bacterium]
MKVLRLILGDQLNIHHSWFQSVNEHVTYVMVEARSETDYVRHHIQKVIGVFAAMRHFANHLSQNKHSIIYLKLNDPAHGRDVGTSVLKIAETLGCDRFEYQQPDEYRLSERLIEVSKSFKSAQCVESEHFLSSAEDFKAVFKQRSNYRMEDFYRFMRRKTGVLMNGASPEGGQWNYDAENRKKLPVNNAGPMPLMFDRDCSDIHQMLIECGVQTIGSVASNHFLWPTTRDEGLRMLSFFIDECLPYFGDFQDAMTPNGWSLYHSRLSFSLNLKLISPREVIEAVEAAYYADSSRVSISQAEGFIRQILGWREFMRGVYFENMPAFASKNFFENSRPLPEWFWTGKTDMACLKHAISQSLEFAYAHHIQRLMITGNFALLAGIDPDQVDDWYLGIYIDAFEWVEITNTRGMSQFADGGMIATKPYVSGGNYINKMSHYCKDCRFDVAQRTGPNSCPFNALYWNFIDQHRDKLQSNHRMAMPYRTWDKMDADTRVSILSRAESFLANLK